MADNPGKESGVPDFSDGDDIILEDGTVEGDAGFIAIGVDQDDKARPLRITGASNQLLRVSDENSRVLNEILDCQKKIVMHLELLTEVKIEDHNIAK
jgi:hypothetical protein